MYKEKLNVIIVETSIKSKPYVMILFGVCVLNPYVIISNEPCAIM